MINYYADVNCVYIIMDTDMHRFATMYWCSPPTLKYTWNHSILHFCCFPMRKWNLRISMKYTFSRFGRHIRISNIYCFSFEQRFDHYFIDDVRCLMFTVKMLTLNKCNNKLEGIRPTPQYDLIAIANHWLLSPVCNVISVNGKNASSPSIGNLTPTESVVIHLRSKQV